MKISNLKLLTAKPEPVILSVLYRNLTFSSMIEKTDRFSIISMTFTLDLQIINPASGKKFELAEV